MSDKREREKRREERLQKETESHAEERRKRLVQLGGLAALVVLAAVIVLIVAVNQNQGSGGDTNLEDVSLVEQQLEGIPQHGTVLGEPGAKATLIEFGDLQCPICKAYSEEVIPRIVNGPVRRGESKLDFRNFTIISQQSVPAGAAALAAGEQGRGWNFIELFYRNQGEERSGYVTDEFLTSIARGAKVPDIAKWNEQRKSKRLLNEVARTTREASNHYEFNGTPSFVVQGPGRAESLGTPESTEEIEAAIGAAR
jgi:protein-disulfide isomerase